VAVRADLSTKPTRDRSAPAADLEAVPPFAQPQAE